ncbi:General secretion pathway protein I [Escherichia coli O5:K4(L):H4 str. ATCC 23502]|nr:General secretion pathway protein I [Escherichia coli O5:K4(L):H4 str. ATCC 23502]
MNKQSGMTLLEVLLAMSIFTAVALTLMSSMQGQRNAIERMRNETLALWIADTATTVAAGRWQYSEVAVTRCPALF